MRFHIRYEQDEKDHVDTIEANSPHEAVVKFEQLRSSHSSGRSVGPRVTSVCAIDAGEESPW